MRKALIVLLGLAVLSITACHRAETPAPSPTRATTALIEDPRFEALAGAAAYYGYDGAHSYRFEIPEEWNRDLVIYLHGQRPLLDPLVAEFPPIREFLVEHGYAWASLSYDTNELIVQSAAAQAISTYRLFDASHSKPNHVYAVGQSMGGGVALNLATHSDLITDGVLALCSIVDVRSTVQSYADFFVAGAFAAGVRMEELEGMMPSALMRDRIQPTISDPIQRKLFERIWIAISGGERAFASEGLRLKESALGSLSVRYISEEMVDNSDRRYAIDGDPGLESRLNDQAVRLEGQSLDQEPSFTGNIAVPVMMLHTTGDGIVPLGALRQASQLVDSAGKSSLLVQRTVRSPIHCGMYDAEVESAFDDLVLWVETGVKPEGESLDPPSSNLGAAFTMWPRLGSPEAERVPGADQRYQLRGSITLDGQPWTPTYVVPVVESPDGRLAACWISLDLNGNSYQALLPVELEVSGCDESGGGGKVTLLALSDRGYLLSTSSVLIPAPGTTTTLDIAFDSRLSVALTIIAGRTGVSTLEIDAKTTGDSLCAQTSNGRVGPLAGRYLLIVRTIGECALGSALKVEADGRPVGEAIEHRGDGSVTRIDIED